MKLKKKYCAEGKITIFDEACGYKRADYWPLHMQFTKKDNYSRKSLLKRYSGITIISFKVSSMSTYNTKWDIEAPLLDKADSTNLATNYKKTSLPLLYSVASVEQYEHLSWKSHMQKKERD